MNGTLRPVNSARARLLSPALALLALALAGCATYEPKPLRTTIEFKESPFTTPEFRSFLETQLGHPIAKWPMDGWSLETLTYAAYYSHPSLEVARARWRSAVAAELSAGARPNPTLSASPTYNFSSAAGVIPWKPALDFDLPIETMGKRGLRLLRARQASEVARWELHSAAWKVRTAVRDALIDSEAAASVSNDWNQEVLLRKQMLGLLEQRLKAGAVSEAEVSPARLAYDKASLESARARQDFILSSGRITESVGLLKSDPFDRSLSPRILNLGLERLAEPELRRQTQQALENRADIRAALAEYAAAQAALQLEIAKQYPDVHLGTGYEYDQGDSKWKILSLNLELPVFNRNQGPIAEARAKREEAAARFHELQTTVLFRIQEAGYAYQTIFARSGIAALYKSLREHESLIEAQVKAGAADAFDSVQMRLEQLATKHLITEEMRQGWLAFSRLENALQISLTQGRVEGLTMPVPSEFIEINPRVAKEKP